MQSSNPSNRAYIIGAVIAALGLIIAALISARSTIQVNIVSSTSEALAGQATIVAITDEALQATMLGPTQTPLPTQTPYPTYTLGPTLTSISLPSTTPTASLTLPFEDNFDRGMKSEWRVIQGQPLVVDGRLSSAGSSNDEAVLELGDSFTTFTVDFDFEVLPNSNYLGFIIGRQIRYTGTDYCCNRWESFSGGEWQYIIDGAPNGLGRDGHAQVIVSGNTYTLFVDGQLVSEITYGTPPSGPFAISVDYRAFIDNFKITID